MQAEGPGGIASPSDSCRIVAEAEDVSLTRDENTLLSCVKSSRRAGIQRRPSGRKIDLLPQAMSDRQRVLPNCALRQFVKTAGSIRQFGAPGAPHFRQETLS